MFKLKPHHLFTALLASLLLFCTVPDIAAQNQITPRKQTHQTQQKKRTPAKKNKPPKKQSAPQRQNNPQPVGSIDIHDLDAQFGYEHNGAKTVKFTFKLNVYNLVGKTINWKLVIYHQNGNPVYNNGNVVSYGNVLTPGWDTTYYNDMWVTIPYSLMPHTGGDKWFFYAMITFTDANTGRSIKVTGNNRYDFYFWKN